MVKIYEIDCKYIGKEIPKGSTIMKFVTLKDYEDLKKEKVVYICEDNYNRRHFLEKE